MPKSLTINDLEPGMILHSPVSNNFGQILIGSGFELSEKHIFMLKTWNIQSVTIQSEDSDDEVIIDEDKLKETRDKLLEIIGWQPRNINEEDLIDLGTLALYNKHIY
jgi:hypothetical protein